MSVLAKLEEIEARLKAAETPTPWSEDVREFDNQDIVVGDDCLVAIVGKPGDRALIANAPADLALLARLVRLAAAIDCPRVNGVPPCGLCRDVVTGQQVLVECLACIIRRELADGGAK